MHGVEVSRGRLTALWVILGAVRGLGGRTSGEELVRVASQNGMRAGTLPIVDGLALARHGDFLVEVDGMTQLTPLGAHALEIGAGDEPSSAVLRLLVAKLLFASPPMWVAWWQGKQEALPEVLPPGVQDLLEAAELFPPPPTWTDTPAWAWWNALSQVPRAYQSSASQKEIGDAGEQLSFEYERRRLEAAGFPDLAAKVVWLARESDAYGFDILSYAGGDFEGLVPQEPIAIEVKSSSLPSERRFSLYLTAHEWEVARELGARSILHLWPSVSPDEPPSSMAAKPVVLPLLELAEHLPDLPSCGDDRCRWETAQLSLQLAN